MCLIWLNPCSYRLQYSKLTLHCFIRQAHLAPQSLEERSGRMQSVGQQHHNIMVTYGDIRQVRCKTNNWKKNAIHWQILNWFRIWESKWKICTATWELHPVIGIDLQDPTRMYGPIYLKNIETVFFDMFRSAKSFTKLWFVICFRAVSQILLQRQLLQYTKQDEELFMFSRVFIVPFTSNKRLIKFKKLIISFLATAPRISKSLDHRTIVHPMFNLLTNECKFMLACRLLIKKSLNETPSDQNLSLVEIFMIHNTAIQLKKRQLLIELSIWKPVQPPKKMDNLLASQLRHAEELWPLELPAVQTILKRFSKKPMQLLINDTHTDANWAHDTKFDTWTLTWGCDVFRNHEQNPVQLCLLLLFCTGMGAKICPSIKTWGNIFLK